MPLSSSSTSSLDKFDIRVATHCHHPRHHTTTNVVRHPTSLIIINPAYTRRPTTFIWIFIAFYIFIFTIKIEYFWVRKRDTNERTVSCAVAMTILVKCWGSRAFECRTERENPEESGAKRKVRVREWIFILFLSFDRKSWIRILCITRKTTNWFCWILFIASSSQRFQSRHEQNISSVLHSSSTTLIDVFKPIMNLAVEQSKRSRTATLFFGVE